MGTEIKNLSVIGYAKGFTLWHCKATGETIETVTNGGFFDDVWDILSAGDMIMIYASDGAKFVVVSRCDDRSVSVSNFL